MTAQKPDWQQYHTTFPIRYLSHPEFDGHLAALTHGLPPRTLCLDIGGGPLGTPALQGLPTLALDPHCQPPLWASPIRKDCLPPNAFGLIVARNSINYLTLQDIQTLPALLAPGGTLTFNTFLEPTPINRPFTNAQGDSGWESTRIHPPHLVEHTLRFDSGEKIVHHFFHHPRKMLERALTKKKPEQKPNRITTATHKSNSIIFTLTKPT